MALVSLGFPRSAVTVDAVLSTLEARLPSVSLGHDPVGHARVTLSGFGFFLSYG